MFKKVFAKILWSICSKAGRTCLIVFLRQQRAKPFIRSEEAEHLQLDSRTSTWKRGRYRETNCNKISGHLSVEHFCVEDQLDFFFELCCLCPVDFFIRLRKKGTLQHQVFCAWMIVTSWSPSDWTLLRLSSIQFLLGLALRSVLGTVTCQRNVTPCMLRPCLLRPFCSVRSVVPIFRAINCGQNVISPLCSKR